MVWTKEWLMPAAKTPPAVCSQLSTLNPGAIMAFTFQKLIVYPPPHRTLPIPDCWHRQSLRTAHTPDARHRTSGGYCRPSAPATPRASDAHAESDALTHAEQTPLAPRPSSNATLKSAKLPTRSPLMFLPYAQGHNSDTPPSCEIEKFSVTLPCTHCFSSLANREPALRPHAAYTASTSAAPDAR